jgi:hypothetical protein
MERRFSSFIYSSFPKLKLTKKNNRSFIYNFTFEANQNSIVSILKKKIRRIRAHTLSTSFFIPILIHMLTDIYLSF